MSNRLDYENCTYQRQYAHHCDALMLRDGWQSILDYGDIQETSNWIQRRRYIYRLPCRTESNAQYHADYNAEYNADSNADYNTEFYAISVSMLYYREYYTK